MVPWELLDTARIPGGDGLLRLMRRGTDYVIRLDGTELMSSRTGGSEEALARLGCAGLAGTRAPRVLIGGLGMGFTLRAALALLGPEAAVTVAELVPAVVAWGRGPLAAIHAGSLDDPRVLIHEGDVGQLIRNAEPAGATTRSMARPASAAPGRRSVRVARWPFGRRRPTTLSRSGFAAAASRSRPRPSGPTVSGR